MGLVEKRKRFYQIRGTCKIIVRYHAYADHPERNFSELELKNLVKNSMGRVTDNTSPEAIPESFLYLPKDDDERECKLVILLKEIEIEDEKGTTTKETIIVCSAWREV